MDDSSLAVGDLQRPTVLMLHAWQLPDLFNTCFSRSAVPWHGTLQAEGIRGGQSDVPRTCKRSNGLVDLLK
ncbi:hypothetical protein EJB05_47630, partial [Eragrostis curvula]